MRGRVAILVEVHMVVRSISQTFNVRTRTMTDIHSLTASLFGYSVPETENPFSKTPFKNHPSSKILLTNLVELFTERPDKVERPNE